MKWTDIKLHVADLRYLFSRTENLEVVNSIDDSRPQYRLGDAILIRDTSCGMNALRQVATDQRHFQGTVLYDYASKIESTNPLPQWEVLKDVVSKKTQEMKLDIPREDELVVHLRMGDSKGYEHTAEKCFNYILNLINNIETPISLITIVTAIHFGKLDLENRITKAKLPIAVARDTIKIRKILDLFSCKKIRARLYSHQEIDIDFCFLSNSKYLVLGNGHFSLCAAMISNAEYFVPPWARTGSEVDMDQLLSYRKDFTWVD